MKLSTVFVVAFFFIFLFSTETTESAPASSPLCTRSQHPWKVGQRALAGLESVSFGSGRKRRKRFCDVAYGIVHTAIFYEGNVYDFTTTSVPQKNAEPWSWYTPASSWITDTAGTSYCTTSEVENFNANYPKGAYQFCVNNCQTYVNALKEFLKSCSCR